MGRPSNNLTARLNVRMTPVELQRLRDSADAAGTDLTSYVRSVLLGQDSPRRSRRRGADQQALASAAVQLTKLGTNVNQLARVANACGDLPAAATLGEIDRETRRIGALMLDALSG